MIWILLFCHVTFCHTFIGSSFHTNTGWLIWGMSVYSLWAAPTFPLGDSPFSFNVGHTLLKCPTSPHCQNWYDLTVSFPLCPWPLCWEVLPLFGFPYPLYVYEVPFFPLEEVWVALTTATKSFTCHTKASI